MKAFRHLSLLAALALLACERTIEPSAEGAGTGVAKRPGSMRFHFLPGLEKRSASGADADTLAKARIDCLSDSTGSYFLLQNAGDSPISDVRLSSDHPAFQVSPSRIDTLRPMREELLSPIVRLRVDRSALGDKPIRVSLTASGSTTSENLSTRMSAQSSFATCDEDPEESTALAEPNASPLIAEAPAQKILF